jgi:hypothetical protein
MNRYSDKFDDLLVKILQEYFKVKYKAINCTNTYTRKALLEFSQAITDRVMYKHCIEDRVVMHEIYDTYHEWLDENVDRLAKEELELKDSLNEKDIH